MRTTPAKNKLTNIAPSMLGRGSRFIIVRPNIEGAMFVNLFVAGAVCYNPQHMPQPTSDMYACRHCVYIPCDSIGASMLFRPNAAEPHVTHLGGPPCFNFQCLGTLVSYRKQPVAQQSHPPVSVFVAPVAPEGSVIVGDPQQ